MTKQETGTVEARPPNTLGEFVREKRQAAGLTQVELEELAKIGSNYIAAVEQGRIAIPPPHAFNRIKRVLGFPGWEALQEMGYETDVSGREIPAGLSYVIQQMSRDQQEALLKVAKVMFGSTKPDSGTQT